MSSTSDAAAQRGLGGVAKCVIYPPVGIARVGNSPTEFFIGPEAPGVVPKPDGGTYKDAAGRVKRQAARFRVYALDGRDRVLGEVTAADARITWTVELANTKAEFDEFRGRFDPTPRRKRNPDVVGDARDSLRIVPGPRTVSGPRAAPARFDTGTFKGVPVPLGELRTDDAGRLIVLGGFGWSSSPSGAPITDYANSPDWHDDVSDGPVSADVDFGDGDVLRAVPAHVIVAPPDFAPDISNAVTLWDVMYDVAVRDGKLPRPETCNFDRDVLPLLRRATGYAWVNGFAFNGHGRGYPGNFLDERVVAVLRSKTAASAPMRRSVFERFREPDADPARAKAQANEFHMPQLWGDGGNPQPGVSGQGLPNVWLTITRVQYDLLRLWADGDFVDAPLPNALPLERIAPEHQPAALTRAALEACSGGAFFPGIEMTYIARDSSTYIEPFRFNPLFRPGSVTRWMACPWQADFYECFGQWWPAQRPDDVVTQSMFEDAEREYAAGNTADAFATMLAAREPWSRGVFDDGNYSGDRTFVDTWHEMGFVVPRTTPLGDTVYVESERAPYAGNDVRDYFYRLVNIDRFPDFRPKARAIVEKVLADADRLASSPDLEHPQYRFFRYSDSAFDARLHDIYVQLEQAKATYDPSTDEDYPDREAVLFRLLQLAPFNQVDGAWLQNVGRPGPLDPVRSLLFSIWRDELGNGDPALNHANVYTTLLHSVGCRPPEDIRSHEYAHWDQFLDGAFTLPVFELAIAEFPDEYFPEILGMTLHLEWEVLSLWPTVLRHRYFGIDTQFFMLHFGIDNIARGHGKLAKDAVKGYLDSVARSGREDARQETWRRVWRGYVAFATTGDIGNAIALANRTRRAQQTGDPRDIRAALAALITQKLPAGQRNHGDKRLGPNRINDLFKDPDGFLDALVESGMVVPGDAAHSPFLQRTSSGGPMFNVFSDEELHLWRSWVESLRAAPQARADRTQLLIDAITALSSRQTNEPTHHIIKIAAPNGESRSITDWLALGRPLELLDALRNPDNKMITPGSPLDSPFIQSRLSMDTPMGRAWSAVAPNAGGRTWRDILAGWVKDGCPLPWVAPPLTPAAPGGAAPAPTGGPSPAPPAAGIPRRRALMPQRHRRRYGMHAVH